MLIWFLRNKSNLTPAYSIKVLKCMSQIITPVLSVLLNDFLTRGMFPGLHNVARVVPILEKLAAIYVSDFRPISMLPVLNENYECVVFLRFYKSLEK